MYTNKLVYDLRNADIVIATGTNCREAIPGSGEITSLYLVMTELRYFFVNPVELIYLDSANNISDSYLLFE